jgi:LmbE family N-acetylglucosaminyl deacetylase
MHKEEKELVPFESTALRGERLLVIAPHPDDESIGCGGLIALHRSERRECRVVIVTDGMAATSATDDAYRNLREEETRRGLALLGGADVRFLRVPDRQAATDSPQIATSLAKQLADFRPDLLLAPSPLEIHPDHVAVSRALVDAIQQEPSLRGLLAMTRVAFYEVSQPFQPNCLVDISAVAEQKWEAIRQHQSQTEIRDYEQFARGLNQYRTMTLPPGTSAAEAYFVVPAEELRTLPWSELVERVSPSRQQRGNKASPSVSVIIRTKNRPGLLLEAVESVRRGSVAAEIIVVNDGGESPAGLPDGQVRLIDLAPGLGRSEAMNRGVEAAGGAYVCFLDDDDLFGADHIATLTDAVRQEPDTVFYTDAVSSVWKRSETGSYERDSRSRRFGSDFDRDLLVLDNYIPLTTLIVPRKSYLAVGGFDPSFDLFEDWDFLLRLSDRHRFVRIPRITCEVRHFEGGDSLVLNAWRDSSAMLVAKQKVWAKHRHRLTDETIFRTIEGQKARLESLGGETVDARGRAAHLEIDVARLVREKEILLEEIHSLSARASESERMLQSEQLQIQKLTGEVNSLRDLLEMREGDLGTVRGEFEKLQGVVRERDELIGRLFAEVERLNRTLDTIYASRSWKLHTFLERFSGR